MVDEYMSITTSMMNNAIITEGIEIPTSNDVLLGRGAAINNHTGNINFREIVKDKQGRYVTSITNIQKQIIAMEILQHIESLNPPGRFIKQDIKTGLWHDVGAEKARKKISQALRENASTMKKKTVDTFRQSLIYTDYTRTNQDTYYDIRDAIENEMSKKDSSLRKQLQLSYNQMQSRKNESVKENTESNMTFSMEVSVPDVEKFLSDHRSGKIKFQDPNASMVDVDTVGTFSIGDMSLSISGDFSSDKLEKVMISFRLDMM